MLTWKIYGKTHNLVGRFGLYRKPLAILNLVNRLSVYIHF